MAWPAGEATPYEVLGVPASASAADVRSAYQRTALRSHPDRAGTDAAPFRLAQRAWELLRDPLLRSEYDSRSLSALPCTDIDLDDLRAITRCAEAGVRHEFEHDCRCGDTVRFSDADLREDAPSVVFACRSCSLCIRVLYTTYRAAGPAEG